MCLTPVWSRPISPESGPGPECAERKSSSPAVVRPRGWSPPLSAAAACDGRRTARAAAHRSRPTGRRANNDCASTDRRTFVGSAFRFFQYLNVGRHNYPFVTLLVVCPRITIIKLEFGFTKKRLENIDKTRFFKRKNSGERRISFCRFFSRCEPVRRDRGRRPIHI